MIKLRTSSRQSYLLFILLLIGSFFLHSPIDRVSTEGLIEPIIPESTIPELIQTESTSTLTDTQRPVVRSAEILPPAEISTYSWTAPDMTRVPLNSKIVLKIEDNSVSLLNPAMNIISSNGDTVVSQIDSIINESGLFILTFTMVGIQLSETYNVFLSTYMTDSDGNRVIPFHFKFSTTGDTVSSDKSNTSGMKENPHGSYMSNTNTCANCHSTHVGTKGKLEGGKYPNQYKDTQNYCMACHDGTLGINIPDNWNKTHTHFDYNTDFSTCTSCHNPHLSWSTENPNLLKDYYVYTHTSLNSADVGLQDSRILLCEACHQSDANIVKTDATHKISHYDKILRPYSPTSDPLALCFSCHNANQERNNPKYVNIERYYSGIGSGHYITDADGIMNGQIPCSDCHETHGSSNIKQLRESLGNEPVLEENKYKTLGTEWNEIEEKTFCLKCHNGSTNLYGKTLNYKTSDETGQLLPWHNTSETCSSCHGTGTDNTEKFRSSAHSPIQKPIYSPTIGEPVP